MGVIGSFSFAAIFYFAAEYEHMSGWKWALASVIVSFVIQRLFPLSFIFVLPGQAVLFGFLWRANQKRLAELEVERANRRAEDQRARQERARQSRAQVDPALEAERAALEAKEEAAAQERKERVRLAREAREREEAERKKQPPPS